tara:strand:- start:177 stop:380 length:204 start_codon:yes stop_codon:yes gene_type:complete
MLFSGTSPDRHTATEYGRYEKGRKARKQEQIDRTASQTDKEITAHTETIGQNIQSQCHYHMACEESP